MNEIKIGNTIFNNKDSSHDLPYFIAEIGVNHEGSIDRAKQMIEEVAKAGGSAVKFQAYKAETLASKDSPAYWDLTQETTRSQYQLFKKNEKFWKKEFLELADYTKSYKIDFLATPFDIESADFLESSVPAYKIASSDITNKPFIEYLSKKEKPILLSTGASTFSEIWRAVEWIKKTGNEQIILLHCVLNYPTSYENANLFLIREMKKVFSDFPIGYSDHTLPKINNDHLLAAWLLGAQIIEKHYTWDKKKSGNDHYHSFDFNDLSVFINQCKFLKMSIGEPNEKRIMNEDAARRFARRSIVAKKFIPKGKTFDATDVICKRPGTGIPPFLLENVIGGQALEDIAEDEILTFDKVRFAKKLLQ